MTVIPKRIVKEWGSARAFRADKRHDLRNLRFALDQLRLGCAFTPIGADVDRVTQLLDQMTRACSVKEWGR